MQLPQKAFTGLSTSDRHRHYTLAVEPIWLPCAALAAGSVITSLGMLAQAVHAPFCGCLTPAGVKAISPAPGFLIELVRSHSSSPYAQAIPE